MSQFKNFITGFGRLNRRQFFIMAIITGIFIGIVSLVLNIFFVSYFGIESAVLPSFILSLILELSVGIPFALAYFIRRGHDFGLSSIFSAVFAFLLAIVYLFPDIYDVLGKNSVFLEGSVLIIFLTFLFYPGSKIANSYGNPPLDIGKPGKIFHYMKTGNWDMSPKL